MSAVKPAYVITNSYRLGLVLWAFCIQYYIVQIIAAAAWKTPFSIAHNTISDLGNTVCGAYGSRYVCSPLYALMNVSFVVLGTLMAAGAILLYKGLPKTRYSLIGLGAIAIAGFGSILVGIFPENTISMLHIIGAVLPFAVGNVGLIVLGFVPDLPKPFRAYAFCSGLVAIVALKLFLSHHYLGLGIGGMERIVAYPQSIWLIIFSACSLFKLRFARRPD